MTKTQIITAFFSLMLSCELISQDIHFSQPEYAPLQLNPALTGMAEGMRANVNYRSQWGSVSSPYNTTAASFDMRLAGDVRKQSGFLSFGLGFFNDQSGDARMATNGIKLNIAYQLLLEKEHLLSGGLAVGIGQRNLKDAGSWGAQYTGTAFNPLAPNLEGLENPQFTYFDTGGGIVYRYKQNNRKRSFNNSVNIGVALYHWNRPNFSFFNDADERLLMRSSVFVSGLIRLGSSSFSVEPGIYFHSQGVMREVLLGSYVRYIIDEEIGGGAFKGTSFAIGLFNRNNDALIAKMLFGFSGIDVGLSYDFNTSELSNMSNGRGGTEIFLQWSVMNAKKANSRTRI